MQISRHAAHLVSLLIALSAVPTSVSAQQAAPADAEAVAAERPWDYDPYRVMIWVVPSQTGQPDVAAVRPALAAFLDRDFAALWTTTIAPAPRDVQVAAQRGMEQLSYDLVTASDPIVAVKKNHPEASRIRVITDVADRVSKVLASAALLDEVVQRGKQVGNPDLDGVRKVVDTSPSSLAEVAAAWADPATEAVLLPRAMAAALVDPDPKLLAMNIDGLVVDLFRHYDKLFVVRVAGEAPRMTVQAVELDCLLRLAGPVIESRVLTSAQLPAAMGRAVTAAFAPMVRIEQAGTQTASGLLRAGGLILDSQSPAAVGAGDFLQPVIRRDDRNGEPLLLQTVDWAYLQVEEADRAKLQMRLYAGRVGGLQGQRRQRTHRIALKVRPQYPQTTIRLHAAGDPDQPLQGYEVYEKDLESGEMQFVGRTDWDGRLVVEKTDVAMRLLYVKNGGAILARLPTVVGQTPTATADLTGDDIRLRGEGYIRGVENAILDLAALRQLLAARIRLRLKNGELAEAKALLDALREQPSYETIAKDMAKKQIEIQSKNPYEQRKLDAMFSTTRQMLVKYVSTSLIRQLEAEVAAATKPATPRPADVLPETAAAEAEPAAQAEPAEAAERADS